jgi:hypothetical protein
MGLDMLLEILWSLEGLATKLALVRFQRNVNSNVRGNVIALDGGGTTLAPGAGEIEVISRLSANMAFANMLL